MQMSLITDSQHNNVKIILHKSVTKCKYLHKNVLKWQDNVLL